MSDRNVEAVRELFERLAEIDFDRLREGMETSSSLPEAATKIGELGNWMLRRVHPEIELDASALPTLTEGNRAHGHQEWFEFWRAWLTAWESFEYLPRRWHDDGDHVVVDLIQRGRLRGGLEYATPLANLWTFEDEMVVRLQMFLSWEEAMNASAA